MGERDEEREREMKRGREVRDAICEGRELVVTQQRNVQINAHQLCGNQGMQGEVVTIK